jgi:hypothetical protein
MLLPCAWYGRWSDDMENSLVKPPWVRVRRENRERFPGPEW